jgi:DNA gyrase subunit A
MGVVFARFDDDDRIIALAKNSERNLAIEESQTQDADEASAEAPADGEDTPS